MKTVFLAEGENHVREALRLLLEQREGFQITGEASHAESLLAQACQQPPNVILLDWNLPGLHPQRLLAALHQHCPTTLILATGVRMEQANAARDLGVDAFLSKQLPPDEFIAALLQAIDESAEAT
ncbi:MAG: response regulator transcription factor [Anaerolineales bacterium]|nr:response regulator transcription factor [Anaerolineales bacterium]